MAKLNVWIRLEKRKLHDAYFAYNLKTVSEQAQLIQQFNKAGVYIPNLADIWRV